MNSIWGPIIKPLLHDRTEKPRLSGTTMVLDKGLGLHAVEDFIHTVAPYVDEVKLTFGTSCCYDRNYLETKIKKLQDADINVMPGGTLTELAIFQGQYVPFLKRCKELGIHTVEVSDGTIDITPQERRDCIQRAADMGFIVYTEVGTKDLDNPKPTSYLNEQLLQDLENGAAKVVIEAKEAGVKSTIYNEKGVVKPEEVNKLLVGVSSPNLIIWEAPLRDQQDFLIGRFGANINIGNCPPEGVMSLETIRNGLGETPFRQAFHRNRTTK